MSLAMAFSFEEHEAILCAKIILHNESIVFCEKVLDKQSKKPFIECETQAAYSCDSSGKCSKGICRIC